MRPLLKASDLATSLRYSIFVIKGALPEQSQTLEVAKRGKWWTKAEVRCRWLLRVDKGRTGSRGNWIAGGGETPASRC